MVPDFSRPSAPRVYDFLLGGKDNFEADRALAGELEAASPGLRKLARVNRSFVLVAARWCGAVLGTGQFLDLGCGLPVTPAVHDAAREGKEGSVVAYVDRDPIVLSHVRAMCRGEGLAVAEGDAADPAAVLGDEAVRGLIDFGRPVCIILGGTLSAMDAETARQAVKGYAEALAAGSALVISCASYADPGLGARMAEVAGAAGEWRNHSREDVASFFAAGGLRLLRGRAGDVRCWPLVPEAGTACAAMIGGVGIKD